MSREIRKVPANWEHPKQDNGNYQPMLNEYYGDALDAWWEKHKQWEAGTHPDLLEDPSLKEKYPFYAMWHDDPPEWESYHTKKYTDEELTHIQLYETVSEGTPISPIFKADEFEKLCEWASENVSTYGYSKASKEKWMQMLRKGLVYTQRGNIKFI